MTKAACKRLDDSPTPFRPVGHRQPLDRLLGVVLDRYFSLLLARGLIRVILGRIFKIYLKHR